MSTTFESLSEMVNDKLSFLNNQYFALGSSIVLILYASLIAPKLPKNVMDLFNNQYVKLLCIFLIAVLASRNPMLSILATLAFVVTIMALNSDSVQGLTAGREDDIYSRMGDKRVTFEQDDNSAYTVLNKNAPQEGVEGAYDETGFAETQLN